MTPYGDAAALGGLGPTLVLATRNEHKVHELRQILAELTRDLGLQVVGAGDVEGAPDVPETEVTFEGNARLKAVALARATGLPSVADDSGLTVDVLGGSPGVFSARWSGSLVPEGATRQERDRANLRLVLDQVADVADEHRGAAFVCAAVLAMPDGRVVTTRGEVRGRLVREPRGTNGFGYDPAFEPILPRVGDEPRGDAAPLGSGRTLAEHTDEEKNAISHRGNAFRAMVPLLREALTTQRPPTS